MHVIDVINRPGGKHMVASYGLRKMNPAAAAVFLCNVFGRQCSRHTIVNSLFCRKSHKVPILLSGISDDAIFQQPSLAQ
ncbi:hypothetical protein CLOSTHATH_04542 [Hungatella hathewayi DSM 13479]|uniref:Uncharacterized protein n=1 Tax=Hungatella hathewayi DSM 13479 TaxID=566550 RepID=D3ALP5_9FIRM|nr:hypothetical protein CLOSTHATH_04542 [Hungatella hathewayi DSM 13479]